MSARLKDVMWAVLCALALSFTVPAFAQGNDHLVYRVKAGDTLYSLAQRYFTSQQANTEVARLNRIWNPRQIPIGKLLRVPRKLLKFKPVTLRVQSFSGPVQLSRSTPVVGKALPEGARIETGANGFISFLGDRSTIVSLPSNTTARLLRARIYELGNTLDVDFEIAQGRGEVVAPKLKKDERFRIRTPIAVTAVRGTIFRVAHDNDNARSVAEVAEGAVAIDVGEQSTLAESGFGVPMSAQGVGDLERLLPAPEIIDPGTVQTGETVGFSIAALDNAARYRTQVAIDAGFLEIVGEVVGEVVGEEAEAEFQGLQNGTYFVRSRGISQTGVEGLSEVFSFKRKRVGISASAEPSALEDGFKFSWLGAGEGDTSFAFQLWNESAPDSPIVDEIGIEGEGFIITGLAPGAYFWRVAAMQVDEDGAVKVWSTPQKINVTQ